MIGPKMRVVTPREETVAERAERLEAEVQTAARELLDEFAAVAERLHCLCLAVAATRSINPGIQQEVSTLGRMVDSSARRVSAIRER